MAGKLNETKKPPRRHLTLNEQAQAVADVPKLGVTATAEKYNKTPGRISQLCNEARKSCAEIKPKQMAQAHLDATYTAIKLGNTQAAIGYGILRGIPLPDSAVDQYEVPEVIPGKYAPVASIASNVFAQAAKTLGLDKSAMEVNLSATVTEVVRRIVEPGN